MSQEQPRASALPGGVAPWLGLFIAALGWRLILIGIFPGLYSFEAFARIWEQHSLFVRDWLPLPQLPVLLVGAAGGSIELMRLLYALIGALGTVALALAWARICDFQTALAFGVTLAFLPLFVEYSLVPHPEGLLVLCVGVAAASWPRDVAEERSPRTWLALAALGLGELCGPELWLLSVLLLADTVWRRRFALFARSCWLLLIPALWLATASLRASAPGPPLTAPALDPFARSLPEMGAETFRYLTESLAQIRGELPLLALAFAAWGLLRFARDRDPIKPVLAIFAFALVIAGALRGVADGALMSQLLVLPTALLLGFAVHGLVDLAARVPRVPRLILIWGPISLLYLFFAQHGYFLVGTASQSWLPEVRVGQALSELPGQASVRLLGRPVPNPWGEPAVGAIFAHHPQLDPHDPRWRFGHAEADAEPTDVVVYWWKDSYELQPRVAPAPSEAVE